jgi:REP element-mobilizing transposase RayT
MEQEPGRKHPAHMPAVERHNEPVIIFLTVCSKDRKRIFALIGAANVIVDAWIQAKTWLVGRYVIMPDHIHLFCAPAVFPPEALKQWVRYWKKLHQRNGCVLKNIHFGSVISGIRNYVGMKVTMPNGTT